MKFRSTVKKNSEKIQLLTDKNSNQQDYGNPQSPTDSFRSRIPSNSSSVSDLPTVKIRAGQTPPSSPYDKSAKISIDFEHVPFKFYSKISQASNEGYRYAVLVTIICVVVPCLIVLLGLLINELRLKRLSRMPIPLKRQQRRFFILLFVITLIKDLIIANTALYVIYQPPALTYEIAYPPIVYMWSLLLFGVPLLFYKYADTKYVFGEQCDTKEGLKSALPFLSSKTQIGEERKMEEQQKRFSEHFKHLTAIHGPYDERLYIFSASSKSLMIISILLALLICLVHSFIPLYEQLSTCCELNVTINATMYTTVISLSALNTLTSSLLAAFNFLFVILWKFAILKEWKRFNNNENNKEETLVNGGPQGVATWWKILQTLKLYSSSTKCMAVMIANMVCVVSLVLIMLICMPMLFMASKGSSFNRQSIILFLLNNLLLYIGIIILAMLTYLCKREERFAGTLIRLKQLNIGYELGRLMGLEQDTIENEPSVRIKVRSMRGCLMLLQELTTVLANTDDNTSDYITLGCFVLASLLIFPSTFVSAKIMLKYAGV